MRPDLLAILLLAWLAAGCVAAPPVPPPGHGLLANPAYPTAALITQRGVLTVLGRQFTLNGYVARDEARGLRLIMTDNFGGVMADVLVKPDGQVFVLKARAPLRPAWVKLYIAADLQYLFSGAPAINGPERMVSPSHFIITRRWYKIDLRTVEVNAGPQPARLFEAPAEGGA